MQIEIRKDAAGNGAWGTERTHKNGVAYKHKGLDIISTPGSIIKAPWGMKIERISYPYADNPHYMGIAWNSDRMYGKLWYIRPHAHLIGTIVPKGHPIGTLQDVSIRYPNSGMQPHWHIQIDGIDPMVIFDIMQLIKGHTS